MRRTSPDIAYAPSRLPPMRSEAAFAPTATRNRPLYSSGLWQICHTRGQWMGYFRANAASLRRRGDNMRLFIAAIAVATLAAAGAAHAVDGAARAMPPPEEVSPAPYNWTGPFFGVSVGVAVGTSQQTASTGDITPNFDLSGCVFGFALRYNWQVEKLLVR